MTIRLLSHDPVTGIKTWHEYDAASDQMKIHTTYDGAQTAAVLDDNKRRQNDGTNGWSPTREWKYVANIPNSVIHSWLINDGIDVYNPNHAQAVRRKLNSNEFRHLRTSLGDI